MQQRRRRPGYTYWFPARRRGWGWGLPHTWQGWLVFDAYLGAVAILAFFTILVTPGMRSLLSFLLGGGILTAWLIWICYQKGEPPRRPEAAKK